LLFATPAIHALRAALPEAHLACLVGPWAQPVLAHNPDVDVLLTCDFPWFSRRPRRTPWEPYTLMWREAHRLRSLRFDVAIVLRFDFWWGAMLASMAGIPARIGYATPDVRLFVTQAIPYSPHRHEVEQNWRLVQAALAEPLADGPGTLRYVVSPGDASWAKQIIHGPSIAIHPGAGAPVKLWPGERWIAVANTLGERYGATIVLTGSDREKPLATTIASGLRVPCVNTAGSTTVGQLAALFALCELVLGPDSGPLHLAVAVGTPTVHLFGPVDPARFGPWGNPDHHAVVQARYPDRPCHKRPCNRLDYTPDRLRDHPCMDTISVETVLAAAERIRTSKTPETSEI